MVYLEPPQSRLCNSGLNWVVATEDRNYRPFHEHRKYNIKNKRIAKMLNKQNWLKRKAEEVDSPNQPRRKRPF